MRIAFLLSAFFISPAATAVAQTGPAPLAAKSHVADAPAMKPRRFFDPEAAASVWNWKPKAKETTGAMIARASKRLTALFARDPKKLDYDTDYWHLLAYMREVPWASMPKSRQAWYLRQMPNARLTMEQRSVVIANCEKKPLYTLTPKEIDVYLGFVQEKVPDLRQRIVYLARKNLGQPYAIYLLGEFPNEVYDPDPTYCLGKGDCVVFSEHMYSMALSKNWDQFYKTLQHVRYKDGVVGMTTRNHFTEADWDKNNAWLVEDVSDKLDATTVTQYVEMIDRARFFSNFGIGQEFKTEKLVDNYIPAAAVASVVDKLQDGDFVNVVRGKGSGVWVGHVGLIGHGKDGSVHFIHSTPPVSKEQPILEYVATNVKKNVERAKKDQAQFLGFKFLRLRDQDLKNGLPAHVAVRGSKVNHSSLAEAGASVAPISANAAPQAVAANAKPADPAGRTVQQVVGSQVRYSNETPVTGATTNASKEILKPNNDATF